jgi:hypothetical protein
MSRVVSSLLIAAVFFVLHHVAVIAGYLYPPPGHEPQLFLRNSDVPQYLSWIALAKDYWLLPSFHNAQPSGPALFQPIVQIIARSGLPVPAAYYGLQFLFQWFAAFAFLMALDQFCSSVRQKRFAILFTLATLPLFLLAYTLAHVVPVEKLLFVTGVIDYSYQSADGLFRGGTSNSPTLAWGTATLLLGFVLLARYLSSGTMRDLSYTAGCFFLSALLHPFEIFVMVSAAAPILLLRNRDFKAFALLSVAGAAGVLPYVIQTLRTPWMMEMSKQARWQPPFYLWPLFVFGLPFAFVIYLLLIRFRLKDQQDLLLASWFACGILLPYVPFFRGAEHFYDGYACCIGILLARRLAIDPQLKPLYEKHAVRFHYAAAALATLTVAALSVTYLQIWRDGSSADPLLIGAVRSQKEGRLLDWMRTHLDRKLVVSPLTLAPWVAAVPLPSMASHDKMSIGYDDQSKLVERFYKGEDVTHELIDRYPVRYIVVPEQSTSVRLPAKAHLLQALDGYRIYELPVS